MFNPNAQKLTITLFVYITLALTLSSPSDAKGFASDGASRRDHTNLKRIVKKRSPFPQAANDAGILGPLVGAGANPTSITTSDTSSALQTSLSATLTSLTSDTTAATTTGTDTTSASLTSSTVSSVTGTISESLTSSDTATNTTSSALSTSTSSSVSSILTSATLNIISAPTTTADADDDNEVVNSSKSTVTRTVNASVQSESSTPQVSGNTSTTKAKTAWLTVLIVVASVVGGVAILWTVFRKWKLGRSSKFDARLQPIDWQPTNPDEGIIPAHRRANSTTSSFHSGIAHDSSAARSGYGATSDAGHGKSSLQPIPDHDFTAGGSSTVGGYADLARGPSYTRGPSPAPQMHEAQGRGASLTRPAYDVGVPLHHQAGYGGQDYNAPKY